MNEKPVFLNLDNLGDGAARELFQGELDRVLENLLDPNADPLAKRAVTLTVTFAPTEERGESRILIEVHSKVAPPRGAGGTVFVGRRDGRAVASAYNPKQARLPFDEEGPKSISPASGEPQAAAQ